MFSILSTSVTVSIYIVRFSEGNFPVFVVRVPILTAKFLYSGIIANNHIKIMI